MQIKDMFRKKIDREIQGVIIVGQGEETNVAQELEEYVVTRELQRHFADFFAAYKKGIQGTTPKMGVWISGFFGSGKSHFLKIMSYLLQNKQVGDKHAIDYFIEDQKITNQMVLADMQLAANTPSDVILFKTAGQSRYPVRRTKRGRSLAFSPHSGKGLKDQCFDGYKGLYRTGTGRVCQKCSGPRLFCTWQRLRTYEGAANLQSGKWLNRSYKSSKNC